MFCYFLETTILSFAVEIVFVSDLFKGNKELSFNSFKDIICLCGVTHTPLIALSEKIIII